MKILLVEDEPDQRDMLKGFLEKQGYAVWAAENGEQAIALFARLPFQLVLLDHRMPDITGDRVLSHIKTANPMVRAIMITAYGSVETAVSVMKAGADDFLEKPVDLSALLEKIRRIELGVTVAAEAATVTTAVDRRQLPVRIIGGSAAMQEVLSLVVRVAPTPWTVLIRGETGTGKELVARLIHLLSAVKAGPFVEVNCGGIPDTLFESELFGHERGAFTGAVATRKGRFELADNGTLFLDEVGELPWGLQSKILRALQEKRIGRVGSQHTIAVNTRVIAATNRDLRQEVARGRFREDLYYRLNVLDIQLPALRQRKEDIPELVDFFLERFATRPAAFHPDAMATLMKHAFPGNVRELEHIVQRTVTLARGNVIHSADLPPEVRLQPETTPGRLTDRLSAVEREMLTEALEKADGVQTRAAERLGISERVLRYKLKKHRISKERE